MSRYFTMAKLLRLVVVCCLGACALSERPVDTFYRLDVAASATRGLVLPGVLEVARFSADGVTGERAVVVSDGDMVVRPYNYHYWVDSPTLLLQQALAADLKARQVASEVVTPELRVRSDYVLHGRILRFERVERPGGGVVVAVELGVVRERDGRVLLLKTYRIEKGVKDSSVAAAVDAMAGAVAVVFGQFASDLGLLGRAK